MSGSRIALDTNQAIAVLNDMGDAGNWVRTYQEVCLPLPVVGELHFGALNSRRAEENLRRADALVARCEVLEPDVATAQTYARIRLELKRKGRPILENDVWIAALCVQHDIPFATADAHFTEISALQVVSR